MDKINTLKCPLLKRIEVNVYGAAGKVEHEIFRDCIKNNCAWWDPIRAQCSILSLARQQKQVIE